MILGGSTVVKDIPIVLLLILVTETGENIASTTV